MIFRQATTPLKNKTTGQSNISIQNKDNSYKRQFDSGNQDNWESIYDAFHQKGNTQNSYTETKSSALNFENTDNEKKITTSPETSKLLQLKGRYIITTVKSGMMIVDQKRAHERILYERFIKTLSDNTVACQIQIFPLTIEIAHNDVATIMEMQPELKKMGFDIDSFGQNMFVVNGTPAHIQNENIKEVILSLIETYNEQESNLQQNKSEQTAKALAKASAIQYNRQLNQEEMQKIIDELFACSLPSISADGKKTLEIVSIEEIMKRF
ncbi:MAG: hypothetical protein IPO21_09335 [Bacteroidales bacterium]|nr:hypothetical protein [Bacteroidales bacterium]